MTTGIDMSVFHSRLVWKGQLTFATGHRIGAERSTDVVAPDLPILRTEDGRPYIPGSSFKGAWRSYTEAILRALQDQPGMSDDNLACLSVGKPAKREDAPDNDRCLTQTEVTQLKQQWRQSPSSSYISVDDALRRRSCWVCRVFGSSWLASKVLIKDLLIDETTFWRTQIRDGVAIDRDTGTVHGSQKYQYETVPAGVGYQVEIVVENASDAELGVVMLGLEAFQRGEILLGGAKSRGLGWCQLEPDWSQSDYITQSDLLTYLLGTHQPVGASAWSGEAGLVQKWLSALMTAVRPPASQP